MRRRLLIGRALIHRPRLVLLDEPTVGLDPQVRQELWALIDRLRSEGTSILMSTHYIEEAERLCDTVTIMSHGKAVARRLAGRAGRRARRQRGVEVYGPPARLEETEAEMAREGFADAAHRHVDRGAAASTTPADARPRASAARPTSRTSSCCSPERRSTDGDRGGDAQRSRAGWIARRSPGVLVREIVNFSSYWRSTTFSSTVEPTIYLLAFGFGFGSLVSTVGGYDYVEFVGTGTVATAVLFSSVFPAMFGTFVKYKFQRTYDAILAAPGRHRGARHRRGAVDRDARAVYGCTPMLVAMLFGLEPSWGMLTVPFINFVAGLRLGVLGHLDRRRC